jgi:hypothetical protein
LELVRFFGFVGKWNVRDVRLNLDIGSAAPRQEDLALDFKNPRGGFYALMTRFVFLVTAPSDNIFHLVQ